MNTEHLKIFERYLNQEMGEEESSAFEKGLREDPALRASYEEYRSVYDAIGDQEVMELRRKLRKISGSVRHKPDRGHLRSYYPGWFWLAALLIVSLCIISVTYLWVNSSFSPRFQGFLLGSRNIQDHIYTLEPAYEELFRYQVRSEDFLLDHPEDSAVVKKNTEIRFIWRTPPGQEVFFDLLNKNGRLVFTSGRPVQSPLLLHRNLPRGIYIYRFRTASQSLHMGLLYIV